MGSEFQSTIRGDVEGNTMLRKYLIDERFDNIDGGSSVSGWDEYTFLQKVIDDNKDCCVAMICDLRSWSRPAKLTYSDVNYLIVVNEP